MSLAKAMAQITAMPLLSHDRWLTSVAGSVELEVPMGYKHNSGEACKRKT